MGVIRLRAEPLIDYQVRFLAGTLIMKKQLVPIVSLVVVIGVILYMGLTQKKRETDPYVHPKNATYDTYEVDVLWGETKYRALWDERVGTYVMHKPEGGGVLWGEFAHLRNDELFIREAVGTKNSSNQRLYRCKITKRTSSFDFEGECEGTKFSVKKSVDTKYPPR